MNKDETEKVLQSSPTRAGMIMKWTMWAVIAIGLGFVALMTFWTLQSDKVLEIKNDPFPVRPPKIAQSDAVYVKINYCKYNDAKGKVLVRLVGRKSIIRLPWPNDSQGPQCLDREIPIVIPSYAGDDIYHFEFDVIYQINPIKEQLVTMRSQEFTVEH